MSEFFKRSIFVFLSFVAFCCLSFAAAKNYNFDGSISREVLENYLDRAVTYAEVLTEPKGTLDKYGDREADLKTINEIGAKFIGRAIYRWGSESSFNDENFLAYAKRLIERIHESDPDIVVQAAVFEIVTTEVDGIKIPSWAFEALGLEPEDRNFSYKKMLFKDGQFVDHWGDGRSVPDITSPETQLWFMYAVGSYVNIGVEAIHLGQVKLMGANDKNWECWDALMRKVRSYCAKNARRHFVIFDAHVPDGGMVKDGLSLLDFNSFPLRIKAVEGKPMVGVLEVGHVDSLFKRSLPCKTPSGWACDSLPYLVEFDNFGVSDHAGKYMKDSFYIWGYDDITWFYLIGLEKRKEFLRYAFNWLSNTDKNGHLQMPCQRIVVQGGGNKPIIVNARAASEKFPWGLGVVDTIKELWSAK